MIKPTPYLNPPPPPSEARRSPHSPLCLLIRPRHHSRSERESLTHVNVRFLVPNGSPMLIPIRVTGDELAKPRILIAQTCIEGAGRDLERIPGRYFESNYRNAPSTNGSLGRLHQHSADTVTAIRFSHKEVAQLGTSKRLGLTSTLNSSHPRSPDEYPAHRTVIVPCHQIRNIPPELCHRNR